MSKHPLTLALDKAGTQQQLASVFGLSQPVISKALKRARVGKPPSATMAIKLSEYLGIPRYELRPDLWPKPGAAA